MGKRAFHADGSADQVSQPGSLLGIAKVTTNATSNASTANLVDLRAWVAEAL